MVFLRVRKLVVACRWKSGPGSVTQEDIAIWEFDIRALEQGAAASGHLREPPYPYTRPAIRA
jgi:hypothetical protein